MSLLNNRKSTRPVLASVQRIRADAAMEEALLLAQKAYIAKRDACAAVLAERDRCARIADQFPYNPVSRMIAELIREGKR
jgi:hypothetical protein